MPIRPENKDRYPKDWAAIRKRILGRAKDCCEQCGVPNHLWIERHADGKWSLQLPAEGVYIVLTIAHLNHTPEDNRDDNLRAWCQRCHNRYDAPIRRQGIKQRLHATKALGDFIEALRPLPEA